MNRSSPWMRPARSCVVLLRAGALVLALLVAIAVRPGLEEGPTTGAPIPTDPFTAFAEWGAAVRGAGVAPGDPLLERGLALAHERRLALARLIHDDPARALEHALALDRDGIPESVAPFLERIVIARGDLRLSCHTAPDGSHTHRHLARIGREVLQARVYGRRAGVEKLHDVSIVGVALDGELAVADAPAWIRGGGPEVELLLDGTTRRMPAAMAYALASERAVVEAREIDALAAGEAASGVHRFLVVPVDFSDRPGDPFTRSELDEVFGRVVPEFFAENSHGALRLEFDLAPATVRAAATAAEYQATLGEFTLADHIRARVDASSHAGLILAFAPLDTPDSARFRFAGLAVPGTLWINGALRPDVICHELGHHFGFGHAKLWVPSDGDPLSPDGRSHEYGDVADVMGISGARTPPHFSPVAKHRFGWLADSRVIDVEASGVHRIHAHDTNRGDLPVALRVFRGQRNLWFSFRENAADSLPAYRTGVSVLRAGHDARDSEVVDLEPSTPHAADSPLQPGRVLVDREFGLTARVGPRVGRGADAYTDIEITLEPLARNVLVDYTRTLPLTRDAFRDVTEFSGGALSGLAALRGGGVAWAGHDVGGIGSVPAGLADVRFVDASADRFRLTVAVDDEHRAHVWGDNPALADALLRAAGRVRRIAPSARHAAIVRTDGSAAVVGSDAAAANLFAAALSGVVDATVTLGATIFLLRDGTLRSFEHPWLADLPAFRSVVALAVADTHLLALRADGTVAAAAFGRDLHGAATVPAGLARVRQVSADPDLSSALLEDGTIVTWGAAPPPLRRADRPVAAFEIQTSHLLVLHGDGAPHVVLHPAPLDAPTGGEAAFTTFATGALPLRYHWQYQEPGDTNWRDLPDLPPVTGVNAPTLNLAGSAARADGRAFRCRVSDDLGRTTHSHPARLGVGTPAEPTIRTGATVPALELTALTPGVAGAAYKWYHDGRRLADASEATLRLPARATGVFTVHVITAHGTRVVSAALAPTVATASVPARGRLVNLSARGRAGAGFDTLIAGFVIDGRDPMPVLVRAIGPSLAALGVERFAADPSLVLRRMFAPDSGVLTNDDWHAVAPDAALLAAGGATGAFPLPAGSRDAALLADLPAGAHGAEVRNPAADGVALAEIYQVDATGPSRLVNLSVRGPAGAGEEALIAGFVIVDAPLEVLVRAVGASLSAHGVPGGARDPDLRLHGANGPIAANASWIEAAGAVAEAGRVAGAFPLESELDAALVVTLEPGVYHAMVTSADDGPGVVLLEVYALP